MLVHVSPFVAVWNVVGCHGLPNSQHLKTPIKWGTNLAFAHWRSAIHGTWRVESQGKKPKASKSKLTISNNFKVAGWRPHTLWILLWTSFSPQPLCPPHGIAPPFFWPAFPGEAPSPPPRPSPAPPFGVAPSTSPARLPGAAFLPSFSRLPINAVCLVCCGEEASKQSIYLAIYRSIYLIPLSLSLSSKTFNVHIATCFVLT